MAVKSYVLVEADVGTAKQVATALRDLQTTAKSSPRPDSKAIATGDETGILSVELVTGPFDVICLVEAADLAELGTQITDGIQSVPGVKRTTTCLTIQVS